MISAFTRRFIRAGAYAAFLVISTSSFTAVRAHGAAGGESLEAGEFKASPVMTIEGHAGLEDNLEGQPRHYAIDLQFGGVFEWGLEKDGAFAIEALIGPAAVYGEAEHFYGRVEIEEEGEEEGEEESGAPFRRVDAKAYLAARYQPNDRFSISVDWKPYYVTSSIAEDTKGLKHEVGAKLAYAFGDGDLNFALGDGLESIADGIFISAENRSGWESDGTYLGNYTDTWLGFGFNVDLLNVTFTGGPRFYTPGDYSGLSQRTDWGGEIALEYPINDQVVLFAHWEPIYSTDERKGGGWGIGWQHHIGTGVSFSF